MLTYLFVFLWNCLANEPETSMTTVILLAAPGALLLAIVILAVILALYQRQRKRTLTTQRDAPPAASASVTCGTAPQPHQAAVNTNHSLTNEYNRPNRQPDLIKSKRGKPTAVNVSVAIHRKCEGFFTQKNPRKPTKKIPKIPKKNPKNPRIFLRI